MTTADATMTVLLVEDEEAHSELVRRAFSRAASPARIEVSGSVREARSRLAEATPDLVIADLRLPDGDGTDLLAGGETSAMCPVVVLTGHGDEHAAVQAMKAGAMEYVVKSDTAVRALPRIVERVIREWNLLRDRDRAEAAMRESERRYRSLVEDMPFLLIRFLPCGSVTFANDRYCRERRIDAADVVGRDVFGIEVGDGVELTRAQLAGLCDEASISIAERLVRDPERGERWERWTHRALFDDAGEVVEYQSVGEDVTDRKRAEGELERLALTDFLTGLPNRRHCQRLLDAAVERAGTRGQSVALLYVDIDEFKAVNDFHGHEQGDRVLRAVATRLSSCVQDEVVARLAGDEFAVVVEHEGDAADVEDLAERIVDSLARPHGIDGAEVTVTASVGVARFPDDARTAESLIACADQAMYRAKLAGKNRFET